MEKRNLEQCWAIKFCVKLNENATETYEKLKRAYGEHAVSRTQVLRWHKAFLDALFIRNSWLKNKQLINSTIVSSFNDSEKGFIVSSQRLRTLGCCITTILPVTLPSPWTNFWPKNVFHFFRSHHTRRVTSSFSQNSNSTSKVVILELWTTFKRSWQTSRGHFPHEDFQHCYREWEQRLRRCVASQGNYFEGNNVDL